MSINKYEEKYLNLLDKILHKGNLKKDRTCTGTLSIFGPQLKFDLSREFPLLTTKKMHWKSIVEELLWFLSGNTNSKVLSDKGVKIWDANGSRKYLDSIGLKEREEGDLGPIYGFQWRHYGAEYKTCKDSYENQGIDQIEEIIYKIKNNPNDRRIILCSWNPIDIPKMALPPCHCLAQFYVENNKLSCHLYQRSADMALGVPFNIASYSLLTCIIAHITDLIPGKFIHTFGDCHIYLNHLSGVKEQISRKPYAFPFLKINSNKKNINDFVYEDFTLINYNYHEKITYPLSV